MSANPPRPPCAPIPFRYFPRAAVLAEKHLRRFILVGQLFAKGCSSLRAMVVPLADHPQGFSPGTLFKLPSEPTLVALLLLSLPGRELELYRCSQDGLPANGLSEYGLEVLRLAIEYFEDISRKPMA